MRVYTVHVPPAAEGAGPAQPALVREGFCWPAFLFAPLWLGWRRLWWPLLAWAAVTLALAATDWAWGGYLELAVQLLLGFEANNLRRWDLARRGWQEAGVVTAPDADTAFARFADAQPAMAARGVA